MAVETTCIGPCPAVFGRDTFDQLLSTRQPHQGQRSDAHQLENSDSCHLTATPHHSEWKPFFQNGRHNIEGISVCKAGITWLGPAAEAASSPGAASTLHWSESTISRPNYASLPHRSTTPRFTYPVRVILTYFQPLLENNLSEAVFTTQSHPSCFQWNSKLSWRPPRQWGVSVEFHWNMFSQEWTAQKAVSVEKYDLIYGLRSIPCSSHRAFKICIESVHITPMVLIRRWQVQLNLPSLRDWCLCVLCLTWWDTNDIQLWKWQKTKVEFTSVLAAGGPELDFATQLLATRTQQMW